MSVLGQLMPKRGATHKRKTIGRGLGSGKGGTSTKGHKGQKARSGGKIIRGFEGGQMPMARRLPKFGFTNTVFKTRYEVLNLDQLSQLGQVDIEPSMLVKKGLMSEGSRLKILARGTIEQSLSVKAHKFSEAAKAAIEKAGGKIEVL